MVENVNQYQRTLPDLKKIKGFLDKDTPLQNFQTIPDQRDFFDCYFTESP